MPVAAGFAADQDFPGLGAVNGEGLAAEGLVGLPGGFHSRQEVVGVGVEGESAPDDEEKNKEDKYFPFGFHGLI